MHGGFKTMAERPKLHDLTAYLRQAEQEMTVRALATMPEDPLIPSSSPLGRVWFACYTNIKCEARAELGLKAKGFDTFLPRETRIRVRRGRKITITLPVFSRYLFVAFDPDREEWFHPIKSTDGVEALLENNQIPVRISAKVIDRLRHAEANGVFDKGKTPQAGEEFRVVGGGPFDDLIGKVMSAPQSNRIKLLLKIMNRAVAVEFSLADLERIQ